MVLHKERLFSIFFGDATNCTVPHKSDDKVYHRTEHSEFKGACLKLCEDFLLKNLILDHQTHSTDGFFIDKNFLEYKQAKVILFENDGDFLITNQSNIGIGVLTADCLPIVFYDTKNNIIAIAHAGWKGSVANITAKVIETMRTHASFEPSDLKIFFGPSAKQCCYEVQPDFLDHIQKYSFASLLIENRDNKLFFDNALLNRLQLLEIGFQVDQIDTSMNLCTMCCPNFHSFRIKKTANVCQTTIAWLN